MYYINSLAFFDRCSTFLAIEIYIAICLLSHFRELDLGVELLLELFHQEVYVHIISIIVLLEFALKSDVHGDVSLQDYLLLWFTKFALLLSTNIELNLVHRFAVAAQNELGLFRYLVEDVFEAELKQFGFISLENV